MVGARFVMLEKFLKLSFCANYRLFNFRNCLGNLNSTRTSVGAVEGCAAPPDTLFRVKYFQSLGCTSVATIKDKSMGTDDCLRAKVLFVGPEDRTTGSASGAEDALS